MSTSTPCKATRLIFALALFASATISGRGQANSSSSQQDTDETVELSPFAVTETKDEGYYNERTFSGARYNKPLVDLPGAFGIVNRVLIEDLNAVDYNKLLMVGVSGITEQRRTESNFTIRGFRTNNTNNLRNGTRSPIAGLTGTTYDIERIEVIKGPASMITGINSSAIGGIVNAITRRPTETRQGSVNLTVGENNYIRAVGNISGPIYRGSDTKVLYRATLGSWTADSDREIEFIDEKFIGGAVQVLFGKRSSLMVEGYELDRDSYEYFAATTDQAAGLLGRAVPASSFPYPGGIEKYSPGRSKDVGNRTLQRVVSSEYSFTLGPLFSTRLNFAHSMDDSHFQQISGGGYNPTTFLQPRTWVDNDYVTKAEQAQIDFVSKYNTGFLKHETSAGYDFDTSRMIQEYYLVAAMNPVDVRNPNFSGDDANLAALRAARAPRLAESKVTNRLASYYLQQNITFWDDRVILVGGYRWINPGYRSTIDYMTNVVSEQNLAVQRVYRYGAVFKPIPNVSVYYAAATNFFPQAGIENPGTPFQYNRSNSLGDLEEVGVKFNFLNGRIYGSAAYFDLARTAVRTSVQVRFPDGTDRVVSQERDNTAKGFEYDLGARFPFEGLGNADLILTYYDAEARTTLGRPADHAPTYIGSVVAKMTLTHGRMKGLMFGATARDESQKTSFNLWFHTPPTYNLFASYAYRDRWTFGLNVDNLTDELYLIEGRIVSGQIGGASEAALPRTIRGSVGFRF